MIALSNTLLIHLLTFVATYICPGKGEKDRSCCRVHFSPLNTQVTCTSLQDKMLLHCKVLENWLVKWTKVTFPRKIDKLNGDKVQGRKEVRRRSNSDK